MAKNTITDEDEDLTPTPQGGVENPTQSAGIVPEDSDEAELSPKDKAGFQRLVAKREVDMKEERDARLKAESEAAELRRRLKEKELAELTESERLQKERDEFAEENAKLKLKDFVKDEIVKRKLDVDDPLVEIVLDSPWTIPPVRRILEDSPTWEEVVSTVKEKLPAYLDSLVARLKTGVINTPVPEGDKPSDGEDEDLLPPTLPTSTERIISTPEKRFWTRSEIASMDDEEYSKHSKEIRKAVAEGRILNK